MAKVMILNGPNLNMLGMREPEIYGHQTLEDIEKMCREYCLGRDIALTFRQTNNEGRMVDWIQETYKEKYDALIINAAAYTHTSLAIHDALKLLDCPVIEVHLSDPKKRETFRHFSYIEPVAMCCIAGQGAKGYITALEKLEELYK